MADRRCAACGAKCRDHRAKCPRCSARFEDGAPPHADGSKRWLVWVALSACAVLAVFLVGRSAWSAARSARVLPAEAVPKPAASRPAAPTPDSSVQADSVAAPRFDTMSSAAAAFKRGDFGSALRDYERIVAENPSDAQALTNLGQTLARLGRFAEAIPFLERAVAADPTEWSFHFNLAHARGRVNDWSGAVAAYREADGLFPGDHATLYNLGLALQKTGADAEAAVILERAVAAEPSDPSFVLALAQSYMRLQRTPEARQALERFLSLAPESADAAAARTALGSLQSAPVMSTIPPSAPTAALADPPSGGQ
jgi:Flp pilus assembly protein TadD